MVGANSNGGWKKALEINEATMPNIVHTHKQDTHTHETLIKGVKSHHHCNNGSKTCAADDSWNRNETTWDMEIPPEIFPNEFAEPGAHPVDYEYEHSFGDLYPRHMRVEFIFKCF